MNLVQAIFLGVVQGLTEFLPVSSSGHLLLVEKLLSLPVENLRFEVVLHLGTLISVIIVFRKKVAKILKGLFTGRVRFRKGRLRFPNEPTRLAWLLVMASIPAFIIGFLFGGLIEELFLKPLWVGIFLFITGAVLFATRFVKLSLGRPGWRSSILVGLAQAVAILPGISRSGVTIATGIYAGVQQERAAEFSFLLSIPLILGAGIEKVGEIIGDGLCWSEFFLLLAGALAAAGSGYVAIKVLLTIIKKSRLHYFAYYCWLAGLLAIFWLR